MRSLVHCKRRTLKRLCHYRRPTLSTWHRLSSEFKQLLTLKHP